MVEIQNMGSKEKEENRADGTERLNYEQNETVGLTHSIRTKHLL